MQIVIEIPEKVYNALTHTEFDANLVVDEMRKAIANGTPLPEHHGRLIDEQQIIDRFKPIEKFKHWCVGTDGLFNVLSDAPTIIEADKGSESK